MANWGGRLEFSATRAKDNARLLHVGVFSFGRTLNTRRAQSQDPKLIPLENYQGMSEKQSKKCILKICLFPLSHGNLQSRQIKGALIMTKTPRDTNSQSQRSKPNLSTSETFDTDDIQPAWSQSSFSLMAMKIHQHTAQLSVRLPGVSAPSSMTAFTPESAAAEAQRC